MGLLYDLSGSYQISWLCLAFGFTFAAVIVQFSRRPVRPEPVGTLVEQRERSERG
jgi:hypothetical protein